MIPMIMRKKKGKVGPLPFREDTITDVSETRTRVENQARSVGNHFEAWSVSAKESSFKTGGCDASANAMDMKLHRTSRRVGAEQ
jgi:hypothetical protein